MYVPHHPTLPHLRAHTHKHTITWHVQPFVIPGGRSTHVVFKVPESAVDGTFLLTDVSVTIAGATASSDFRTMVRSEPSSLSTSHSLTSSHTHTQVPRAYVRVH